MVFIRVKYSKKSLSYYAYLVKTRRKKKRIQQKTLAYLGLVFKPKETKEVSLKTFLNSDLDAFIKEANFNKIIKKLIEFELYKHEFTFKKTILEYNLIKVDLLKNKVYSTKNKPIVIELNEGFLCNLTLKNIMEFKFPNSNEKECAKALFNSILSVGVKLDEEIAIKLFNKLFKEFLSSTP